jgi:phosphate transport system substrate-binding protein
MTPPHRRVAFAAAFRFVSAHLIRRGLLLAIATLLCAGAVEAQTRTTIFCLNDGTKIGASRFETRDGKFILYVNGANDPLEYPTSAVRGINVDPCPAPAPASAAAPAPAPNPSAPIAPAAATGGGFGVQGSNTIGERLMPMMIDAYAKKLGAKTLVKLTGKEEEEISFDANGVHSVVDLKAHGSGTAAKALVDGKALIGMSSRRLKPEEVKLVDDKFHVDALAQGNEHVLALDGLAIVVNAGNPVQKLDLAQIAGVFAGRIVNWRELGGADRPIRPLRRDDKSGTFDSFKSLVLAPAKLDIAPQMKSFESSEALSDEVSRDVDAIGFVAMPYVNRNVAVAIGSSCGLVERASKFSVKTESYPLARRLYLYTAGEPANATAKDLLSFALSDGAQGAIEEAEFVDQAVMFEDVSEQRQWANAFGENPKRGLAPGKTPPADAVAEFRKLAGATRRASAVLRFKEGSAELDNRAIEDVGRLARFLRSPALQGKPFYVVGFADANGDWRGNAGLARHRAQRVAEALKRAGLPTPANAVKTFSFLAPVACNDGEAGSAKNRRVEIWVGE